MEWGHSPLLKWEDPSLLQGFSVPDHVPLLPVLFFLRPRTDTLTSVGTLRGLPLPHLHYPLKTNKQNQNSFIGILCASHTTHPFKIRSSVGFSLFIEWFLCHQIQFWTAFMSLRRHSVTCSCHSSCPHSQPEAAIKTLAVPTGLPTLDIPYKWNYAVCGLFSCFFHLRRLHSSSPLWHGSALHSILWLISHCMDIPRVIYLFISWWTFGLFPLSSHYE